GQDRCRQALAASLPLPHGAGSTCDGQVLVTNDILGIYDRFTPKFVKKYANLSPEITAAVKQYAAEVKGGAFPGQEHSF
ncbi:3-methyl-2-oxobutanoate hydroxymethyltransferase, partial [Clostridium perfringens]|nr:3-methyl-2-oxobutanoate hydroxymethyltransferase [Clostridium perfringens]